MCFIDFFQIFVDMASSNAMIGELSTSQKLDGTNYEMWHRKIQYLLDDKDLLEHLKVAKVPPSDKDKDGKLIDTTFVQYQESVKAYHDLSNKDRKACFTILYCIHDHLIGEFETCPTAKDMYDKLSIRFGHTSMTRLRIVHLKGMQYKIDSIHTIAKHLQTMSAMVCHLKAPV